MKNNDNAASFYTMREKTPPTRLIGQSKSDASLEWLIN